MNLCSSEHEEIVYDGGSCPLCVALDEIQDLQYKAQNLQEDVSDLKREVESLRDEIYELRTN